MAIYAISDLHLSLNTDKSMEVFGSAWENYVQRLSENWNNVVKDTDTVILGGDISWEMKLSDCVSDFKFIESLNGRKIISKGNHDLWWETASKHNTFLSDNNFKTINFLYNNAYSVEDTAICGTRWWTDPTYDSFRPEDEKVFNHEIIRLENSFIEAKKLNCGKTIAVLHYSPFNVKGGVNTSISALFSKYNVSLCIYGHLHGEGLKTAREGTFDGVEYYLTSADFLGFTPREIKK